MPCTSVVPFPPGCCCCCCCCGCGWWCWWWACEAARPVGDGAEGGGGKRSEEVGLRPRCKGPGLGLRAVVGRWMAGSVERRDRVVGGCARGLWWGVTGAEDARRTTEGICISTAGSSPASPARVPFCGLSAAGRAVRAGRAGFVGYDGG